MFLRKRPQDTTGYVAMLLLSALHTPTWHCSRRLMLSTFQTPIQQGGFCHNSFSGHLGMARVMQARSSSLPWRLGYCRGGTRASRAPTP